MDDKYILDVCCGSRMFYFDKSNKNTIYMDIREFSDTLCDGRELKIKPGIIGDFRNIPFDDNSFRLVIFDPPHLIKVGDNSWLAKKYGKLDCNWQNDIRKGFEECFRVLEDRGMLVFKWNEEQIKLKEILALTTHKPLLGNKRNKTHWIIFIKKEEENKQ